MTEPIFFVSHFRIKAGNLDELKRLTRESTDRLLADKPRTPLFLSYVDEADGTIHFLHAFADADSMDVHFEGSDERARAAYEFIEPVGWEFYGRPSESALQTMRQAAASAGVTLTVHPDFVAGFLRLAQPG